MRKEVCGFFLAATILGCDRDDSTDVRTQSVPKQQMPTAVATSMPTAAMPPLPGATVNPDAEKALAFDTPPGWSKEPPKSMRVVSFTIDGGAELIASQFPMFPGSLLDNLNRWRKQTGLPPAKSEIENPPTDTVVNGVPSKRFQIDSPDKRMILVWSEHGGTWFFKLLGPKAVVEQQTANFDRFIQSVKFQ